MGLKKECSEKSADFTFINISNPDDSRRRSTQKVVRHHVMARVGQSRKKPPRSITFAVRLPPAEVGRGASEDDAEICSHGAHQDQHCYENVAYSLHPYALFPVETDGRARQLIHFMHSEGDYLYRPFRNEWFAMAVIDRTAFYLSLANAALFFHQMTERKGCEYGDFEESSKYLSLCLNGVAQRLERETHQISDGVITTVLGFLCHDSNVGRWDRYGVHMQGLNNIIQVRGGFQTLNSTIVMFTCWFDILGASVFDRKPLFPVAFGLSSASAQDNVLSPSLTDLLMRIRDSSEGLFDVTTALEKTAHLTMFVNNNGGNPLFWKDGASAASRITPVLHLLLSLRRFTDPASSGHTLPKLVLQEMVRLALLIVVASVKQAFALIADELAGLLQRFSTFVPMASRIDTYFPELSLWAIIMVATLQPDKPDLLHARATLNVMRAMGVKSGKAAIEIAQSFIWIDKLMEMSVAKVIFEIDNALCCSEADQEDYPGSQHTCR
ncbi:hypothetical protein Z517_03047 [Fonsecaea pedrosoi CBS 271.37]|uniref:Transcription factor domain-containing protein n=1 Tax=Fonsecaea pedrosoi CBS 271.37 TaxID=1442368 RepID=A0A0D2E136_9EURO|nr:uncharacterized protein Z517_03047 [Fonsecaea pedrosoi CBS 271.37]KIW83801.1 hypothetical protein Z517_03047 [Fonsecaea pedrosoi CBS 271.37]